MFVNFCFPFYFFNITCDLRGFNIETEKSNIKEDCSLPNFVYLPNFVTLKQHTLESKSINPMQALKTHYETLKWVFFFLFLFLICPLSLSDPRISEASFSCGKVKAPPKANFIPTFVQEMDSLSQNITTSYYGTHSVNSTLPIYGLAQCYQDLSHTDCLLCFTASRTKLPRCIPSISARIYLDGCFLRYDNYSFYEESTDPLLDKVNCSSKFFVSNRASRLEFVKNVEVLVDNLTKFAVDNDGFGIAEAKGVFGLAQCWKTIGKEGCRACLKKAALGVTKCAPKTEGTGLIAGCYLKYSTVKFYNDEKDSKNGDGASSSRTGVIIAVVLAAAACLVLSLYGAYAVYSKLLKTKNERKNLGAVSTSYNSSSLKYKYETLEKATDYFNPSRKLGQGGAGSVFKGTLPNGTTVAVKRLVFNTRQWVDEFFNEVNLITGIQHKNLVKLLGCSIEGPESLLVYEFVPNRSLDLFIFEKNKVQNLSWRQRFNIIVGTAEGLAYLHKGCKIRIIHRDIKSSNILLDEDLNPKIADFGLARCFASDQTHLSTEIAGTIGYMAPEYLLRGQLTEKADIYSFGVLVLEIVCGRRNSTFSQDSGSLLEKAWRLYRLNNVAEAVDPCLRDDFPTKEVSSVVQIGLLCTQASAALRPAMDEVVLMLTNKEKEIPSPSQPPFVNASVLRDQSSSSIRSYGLSPKAFTKFEASCSSTELSSGPISIGAITE